MSRSDTSKGFALTKARRAMTLFALVSILASSALVACVPTEPSAPMIALLLPDSKTARYESFDRPIFEERVAELGDFEVVYSNADQDAAKQQTQAESALASGARVLVLDPVDGAAAVSIVAAANAQNVPVISYDRLVLGGTLAYYVSFDNEEVGALQGSALVAKLDADKATGGILMVHGSPTDNNAGDYKTGSLSEIEASGYEILAQFDTPDWSPDKAQEWVAGQLTQYSGKFSAIYAANDGTASGAIAALKAANVSPWPIVTGQDADLAAIQRIVAGEQYMTVYKAIRLEAEKAAEIAVALVRGEEFTSDTTVGDTRSTLFTPVAVTIDNIMETVVADGFWTVAEICTPDYAAACAAAGIE
jgi:D-xylose transport system substrate-binding protein